jgi:2-dehydro-3-deoxyphosphooctonate aldolase (KDO 8-P synthase)
MKQIQLRDFVIGDGAPLVLIAGPCVIESREMALETAFSLKETARALKIPYIFKASYDKANRSSVESFRGPGLKDGLAVLSEVKTQCDVPVLSDVHRFEEIREAADVLDIMQVPAFLCRQTDFVMEVAAAAKIVNIKKGQFLAPWDVSNVIEKVQKAGNENILITERGACFGYNNLVADFRSLPILRRTGYPVIFDATHSVQLPGGAGYASSGDRSMIPYLARAAVAAGIDGIFFEVHPDPDRALCDGANSMDLKNFPDLLRTLIEIDRIIKRS